MNKTLRRGGLLAAAVMSAKGILGAAKPNFGTGAGGNDNTGADTWRWFYTQQHGDHFTYEVLAAAR